MPHDTTDNPSGQEVRADEAAPLAGTSEVPEVPSGAADKGGAPERGLVEPPGDPGEILKTAIEFNKASLLNALRAANIQTITITYEGSCDEASGYQVETTPEFDSDLAVEPIEFKSVEYFFDKAAQTHFSRLNSAKAITPEVAIERLSDQLIQYFGHVGFENGDGGRGEITIDVAEGNVESDHYEFLVQEHKYSDSI
jgi:hypothetical protein